MLTSADFMAHHPLASHDELLAQRHIQRAPRVCSLEAKLTSSLDDCVCVAHTPKDASSRDPSSSPTSAPPSASHDEFLAQRHIQRAPRVCSLEAKLTSSLDDCVCVAHTLNDASSRNFSYSPTSAPPSASHGEFLARRHAEHAPRVRSLEIKSTSSLEDCFVHPPKDDTSSESSCAQTSPPFPRASPTSSMIWDASWMVGK
jgi:hypothetical protein